ncbi:ketosteroid isomerase-related protein [Deinococcus peraridilitoris]|uniref:SnoaL-like domain-containing protein n=1 Tax=Deinococcus peraridilitoris (strain DSM 19664 / LMG 22246 / CIP 109416 / KR-200) TaxID=937777 RepID=L0A0P8_DEIPD|nr:ketosteroid isomerase-related protein [Deinococcus peraridilitoris]AFZ66742.1 hypothetical protein Deipe_1186 [Deinococcus peraridilitoris DSM 19664]
MQKTLDVLRRYYDAFNAGDWDTFFGLLNENVVHDLNQGGREEGLDAFRQFIDRMNRSYRERLTDIVVLASPDGSRAAAEYIVHGTYLATDEGLPEARGQTYVLPGGAFFEVADGKITRVTNYYNLQDWLRQVAGGSGQG